MRIHNIGSLFSSAKGGMGWLFRPSSGDDSDAIKLRLNSSISKSGKKYYVLSIELKEGETATQGMERMIRECNKHLPQAERLWMNEDIKA